MKKKLLRPQISLRELKNTPSEVLKEKTIIKAKDILDPSRGGLNE